MNRARDGKPYTFPLIIAADPGSSTKPDIFSVWKAGYCEMNGKPKIRTGPDVLKYIPSPLYVNERVLLVVEKSTAAIPRFYIHRNAAEGVVDRAKDLWGARRLCVVRVDPRRWQGDLGFPEIMRPFQGPQTTKECAIWYCRTRFNYKPIDDNHADARCILQWSLDQEQAYRAGRPNDIDGSRR